MPRIIMISDTHSCHHELDNLLPEGDFLLHAGDLTSSGSLKQTIDAASWLDAQADRYAHVVCIAGNHDWALQAFMTEEREDLAKKLFGRAHYLRDEAVIFDSRVNLFGLAAFTAGSFEAQDEGSQLLAKLAVDQTQTKVDIAPGSETVVNATAKG